MNVVLLRFQKAHDVSGEARIPKGQAHGGEWTKGEGPPSPEQRVYKIATARVDALREQLEKLDKKAKKLSLPPVRLEVVKQAVEPKEGKPEIGIEWSYVKIHGQEPKVGGWRFVGVLQHTPKGNIFRAMPGRTIPPKYRKRPQFCEHCQTERQRNDTYVVENEKGQTKQVGRNCLRDFTGHGSPEAIAEWAESWADAIASAEGSSGEEDDAFGREARGKFLVSPKEFMGHVVTMSRTQGYRARSHPDVQAGFKSSTADYALSNLIDSMKRNKPEPVTPADQKLAAKMLAWIKKQPASWYQGNDYRHNLKMTFSKEYLEQRDFGMAASLYGTYKRETEEAATAAAQAKKVTKKAPDASPYMGKLGERAEFKLKVITVRPIDGNYGVTYVTNMEDEYGRAAVWFASGTELEEGRTYTLKATVKDQKVGWKGRQETVLTRAAVVTEHPLKKAMLAFFKAFNPREPRVPAGQPGGGQWTDYELVDEEPGFRSYLARLDVAGLDRERARLEEKLKASRPERKDYWVTKLRWLDEEKHRPERGGAKPAPKATKPWPTVPGTEPPPKAAPKPMAAKPAAKPEPKYPELKKDPNWMMEKATPTALKRLVAYTTQKGFGVVTVTIPDQYEPSGKFGQPNRRSTSPNAKVTIYPSPSPFWESNMAQKVTRSQAQLRAANFALNALKRLDSAFRVRGDMSPRRKLSLAIGDIRPSQTFSSGGGVVRATYSNTMNQIALDAMHPTSLVHEYGHYVDYAANARASTNNYGPASSGDPEWQPFIRKLQKTDTHYDYMKRRALEATYLTKNEEVFARFFEGWVCHELRKKGIDPTEYTSGRDSHEPYTYQEFETFGKEMKALLRKKGLLKAVLAFVEGFSGPMPCQESGDLITV